MEHILIAASSDHPDFTITCEVCDTVLLVTQRIHADRLEWLIDVHSKNCNNIFEEKGP